MKQKKKISDEWLILELSYGKKHIFIGLFKFRKIILLVNSEYQVGLSREFKGKNINDLLRKLKEMVKGHKKRRIRTLRETTPGLLRCKQGAYNPHLYHVECIGPHAWTILRCTLNSKFKFVRNVNLIIN